MPPSARGRGADLLNDADRYASLLRTQGAEIVADKKDTSQAAVLVALGIPWHCSPHLRRAYGEPAEAQASPNPCQGKTTEPERIAPGSG
jgi:hypothetical protein